MEGRGQVQAEISALLDYVGHRLTGSNVTLQDMDSFGGMSPL